MRVTAFLLAITWTGLWLTPDQSGQRQLRRGEYEAAVQSFDDPMWQGVAWYRAGEFEKAASAFARRSTPEALYNQGNSQLMRGQYQAAIDLYDRALTERPEWIEAIENREIAVARARMTEATGGEAGDQKIGADKIVFDKGAKKGGEDTEIAGAAALSNEQIQALWLRRVQTRPADFLKSKFAYQRAFEAEDAD
jgi:Ca-activated chloride channel homolog